ncbi:hypothetical protein [Streptomyces griseoluteus]|uniref:hypothetical protein n=1 Tax=Streptomyces griseoluteus TaxID=29306 RepID=UPI0019BC3A6A|nr:hypothetical protein [Streptomyces griseoluteus]GHE98438.1 hypothetical protein GCM10017776_14300 [Streptomyces griseoluteus]
MPDEQLSDRGAWVVLGGVHLLNRTVPRRPDEPIRVPPQEVCRPATTMIVRWDTLGPCPVEALHPGGTRLGAARIDGGELFPDAIAGPALRGLVGTEAAPGLVPLCYLAEHPGGGYHAAGFCDGRLGRRRGAGRDVAAQPSQVQSATSGRSMPCSRIQA